jgi:ribosomal protein S4E
MKLRLQYLGQKLQKLWKRKKPRLKLLRNTKSTLIISQPTNFPSGIAVKTDKDTYWIKDGKRYRLISDRAAKSWSFTTVNATEAALTGIKVVGKLGFRDGTLIKNIADGRIYLVSQNKLRHIVDPDSFTKYGLDRSKVLEVSEAEVSAHDLGENI